MEENISASWDSLFCEFSTTQNLIESALITRSNGNHWRLILNPQMSINDLILESFWKRYSVQFVGTQDHILLLLKETTCNVHYTMKSQ